ncbi:hypothetical protein GLYMA_06G188200v4 [Glycine max]|uniref:Uncharacterized protein n=1 Tax=Glycine max TaxID=3847 RepID=A0A0R0JUR3_SOYBN|nr:hypothetical protein GYH30_015557 [Glycine max]KRH54479.1 hypothetical protein GLYMA_06G188200v4 [Glycine max]
MRPEVNPFMVHRTNHSKVGGPPCLEQSCSLPTIKSFSMEDCVWTIVCNLVNMVIVSSCYLSHQPTPILGNLKGTLPTSIWWI